MPATDVDDPQSLQNVAGAARSYGVMALNLMALARRQRTCPSPSTPPHENTDIRHRAGKALLDTSLYGYRP